MYFMVPNRLSEYGLSLLAEGRLNDGTTPNLCSVASMVAPFMGDPLSECSTNPCPLIPSARQALRVNKPPACSRWFVDLMLEDNQAT